MNSLCTLSEAFEYSKRDKIEEWIHMFLHDEGDNFELSDGLKLEKRFFIGPIKIPLKLFERCCGPEENIKYKIDEIGFNERVCSIINRYKDGWDMPPLIINYCKGKFVLNDGNHRYEALVRSYITEYYAIVWITDYEDYQRFNTEYNCFI
ncbi:chromosome partitioning protein ParB [Proteiniborus sp. MB09-C3]|uniref:chromosome partitioning protein ParB n=1 Tax=Proteiniborus sp. MB09-C3 TaxID=3050072 RepID=UPI0025525BC1|nr:chromosome partitioning protein ParB [Proteiniborus sp. MB09-C3]WIV12711.1 chromosome partitioning protein ParB [Proteiniborus sp. MB09-C3]